MSLTFEGDGTISGFDAGLSGFGGLVAVKHAIFTGTQSASVTAGSNVAVTDLSITHALSNAGNKLIISAYFGVAVNSFGVPNVGLGVADDGTLIAIGDAAGSRVPVTVGAGANDNQVDYSQGKAATFVYEPGDTASHVYTVRAININAGTRTLYINRDLTDTDSANWARASSALVIQEVSV